MRQPRILVVEDEGVVSLCLKDMLTAMGTEIVAVVDSGRDAVVTAEKLRPDLVLMDIRLKGEMDGIEAARQIHDALQIPIVFLTAYADAATMDRAQAASPYGFVHKPFSVQRLGAAVEAALRRRELEQGDGGELKSH
jgi:CheY-like chemotaxis protein